jgi:outer membrane protein OmpA-like peptidoglycan-associated protein
MSVEQKRDEDFLDTLIALLLSFGMAIGVWLYAVKPGSSHTSRAVPIASVSEQKPVQYSYPVVASTPGIGLENNAQAEHQTVMADTTNPVVPMEQDNDKVCTRMEKTAEPVTVKCPAPVVPAKIVEAPAPVLQAPAVVTVSPPAAVPVQPQAVTPEPTPAEPKVIIRESIEFANGSSDIPQSAKARLREIARLLMNDNRKLKIVGHTDNVGNQEENLMLSLQRAESVKLFLIAKGVVADRLSAEGVGPTQPIAGNDTEAGRRQNRRIEITE